MDEPWQIYREELLERAEDIPEQRFNVEADMAEAAHEAYESTVDRLVNQFDYEEAEALALAKAFGRAVKEWIGEGHFDWDELTEKLETEQLDWEQSARLPG